MRSVLGDFGRGRLACWARDVEIQHVAWCHPKMLLGGNVPLGCGNARMAAQLYQRGVAVRVIENALVLAAARRMIRSAGSPPLGTIRSLAYFLPVIEEVLSLRVSPDYFQHLRHKIERLSQTR